MSDKQLSGLKPLIAKANLLLQKVRPYTFLLFIALVAVLYGFLMFRINTLSNTRPSSDSVDTQVQAARVPHIDKAVVQQLKSLNDNSVNVQALFNEARSNPFL